MTEAMNLIICRFSPLIDYLNLTQMDSDEEKQQPELDELESFVS